MRDEGLQIDLVGLVVVDHADGRGAGRGDAGGAPHDQVRPLQVPRVDDLVVGRVAVVLDVGHVKSADRFPADVELVDSDDGAVVDDGLVGTGARRRPRGARTRRPDGPGIARAGVVVGAVTAEEAVEAGEVDHGDAGAVGREAGRRLVPALDRRHPALGHAAAARGHGEGCRGRVLVAGASERVDPVGAGGRVRVDAGLRQLSGRRQGRGRRQGFVGLAVVEGLAGRRGGAVVDAAAARYWFTASSAETVVVRPPLRSFSHATSPPTATRRRTAAVIAATHRRTPTVCRSRASAVQDGAVTGEPRDRQCPMGRLVGGRVAVALGRRGGVRPRHGRHPRPHAAADVRRLHRRHRDVGHRPVRAPAQPAGRRTGRCRWPRPVGRRARHLLPVGAGRVPPRQRLRPPDLQHADRPGPLLPADPGARRVRLAGVGLVPPQPMSAQC